MATLIGYGAAAINPYLMFESLDELADRSLLPEELDREEAEKRIVKAIGKGLMKTISKMGISTIQSYCGAQIFEAVGLERRADRPALHRHGVADRRRRPDVLSTEAMERHFRAYPRTERDLLPVGGVLQWRRDGELHVWNPDTIAKLQHAVRGTTNGDAGAQTYDGVRAAGQRGGHAPRAAARPDEVPRRAGAGPAGGGRAGHRDRQALHHRGDEPRRAEPRGPRNAGHRDEPAGRHGRTPARAARTPSRYVPDDNGDLRRSAIKQVASGRFGVTSTTWSTPTSSRSRWPRAPSPARAASFPATRLTTTSPRSATRRRASA